jgi:acetylornithine deacetylase
MSSSAALGPRCGPPEGTISSAASKLGDRELLARLVGFDTRSRLSNLSLADFVSEYLQAKGVRILRNPSADGTKTNLIVIAGPETSDRSGLVLSGHMDVVPADEPDWRSEPFTMHETDGCYVGRGTADMKGFLALAVNRLATANPATLRHPLVLLFTYDEEAGTLGARRFTDTFAGPERLPRNIVIGEPTELRLVRAHKGMLRLNLRFTGRAAHSGYPHLGQSAIEPAGRAITALAGLRHTMEAERLPHADLFPSVPFVALNVGTVAGGVAANVIPDRCELQLGIRLLPGVTRETITNRVADSLRAAGLEAFTLETLSESPAMMLDVGAQILGTLSQISGDGQPGSVMFASDAGWLQRAGFDCVLFGPGSIEVAHRANEFLPADQFRRAGDVLDRLIQRCCAEA